MNSEKLFQILSYGAVFCGFLALWISGVFGVIGTGLFLAALIGGWFLEGSKWQVSERLGTVLIVISLPAFYALYKVGFFPNFGSDSALPGILARLIVTLSAIKLLQRKSDRDWIFLYVMSFFEVLLAAGLSISPLYFAAFITYIFVMVCAVILFEIRKTGRSLLGKEPKQDAAGYIGGDSDERKTRSERFSLPIRRVPATAVLLIIFIVVLAAPMFFLLPRVGGAGFGGTMRGGAETAVGFSDTVRLGGIGQIQQNDEIVLRVRIDGTTPAEYPDDIRWRGVALDTFDNQYWRKSKPTLERLTPKGAGDLIQVDEARGTESFVLQTIYLEPIDSSILFVLPRAVGVQGGMPGIFRDAGGSLSNATKDDRVSYRVLSETATPAVSALRRDNGLYSDEYENYLQLPDELDPRVTQLASQIAAGTRTRYDAARAIESHLQTQFGYTLEQKAAGDQPLADFLFNVREGHCEYFATAMAVMLRTQGVATRVVNGFQRGDFNETAGVFVVRQRNAHSWVEVYFPGEDAWITFDPTPFAGQNLTADAGGMGRRINGYIEALETFWIQYFVAYDSAEQRSLLASVRRGASSYGKQTSSVVDSVRSQILEWWREVRGDAGFKQSVTAVGYGLALLALGIALVLAFVWLYRRIVNLTLWRRLRLRFFGGSGASIVEFYERMQAVLASKGLSREPHQTPLEFANTLGIPEVITITCLYNSVRFGEANLTKEQIVAIETSLSSLKTSVS